MMVLRVLVGVVLVLAAAGAAAWATVRTAPPADWCDEDRAPGDGPLWWE